MTFIDRNPALTIGLGWFIAALLPMPPVVFGLVCIAIILFVVGVRLFFEIYEGLSQWKSQSS